MTSFDEKKLTDQLTAIPSDCQVAFAAACAERIIPHYIAYQDRTGVGDVSVLRTGLELVWNNLLQKAPLSKAKIKEIIKSCEAQFPDEEQSWIPEAEIAEDAVSSVIYTLKCKVSGEPKAAMWAAMTLYEATFSFLSNHYDNSADRN